LKFTPKREEKERRRRNGAQDTGTVSHEHKMETSLELKERREDIKIAEDKVRDDLSTRNVEINVEKSRKRRLSAETMKSRGKRRSLQKFWERNVRKGSNYYFEFQ